jgi:hypothetical protein
MVTRTRLVPLFLATVLVADCLRAQSEGSNAGPPPVTKTDIAIVKRAAEILSSPEKWNRADNRECPPEAKTFSIYCALEMATDEVTKNFQHRGAAMEEARLVIEEVAPDANGYSHRLMDYNNDPNTTFADVQGVFWLLEKHIAVRLAKGNSTSVSAVATAATPSATKADLQVAKRVRELLDSPEKWSRADTECLADAKIFNLICAFEKAEKEITGTDEDGAAIREARAMISELDPGRKKYQARLVDFNADPGVTFADLQKFLVQLEERLVARVGAK